ncbi:hypothetical protein Lspi_1489 [Legionella spiritensis]|uniref:Uncharacterized protein n=2 Tax=Legionella spiritensis TaxID=452 RepID=A0A0W0Z4C4_LEGSP|nr:hypothetical protein Lspi_1489 [Legionella spiritensis]SNV36902.1 Uncharacterised protein [Legionella spiritensis]
MPTYTEFDSSLSLAMLEEALKNQRIKLVLTEIATRLRHEVLPALVAQEQSGLSLKLESLAMQQSAGDKFLGALLPDYSAEYLERTTEGRALLLTTIDNCLRDANTISTHHDFIALMKAIDGMAFLYDVFEADNANTFHLRCRDYIAPTMEEVAIRARRADDLLATTYGIGTETGTDLVLKKDAPTGCLSGKARFFILPVEHRSRTWFEKLADQSPVDKPAIPLIASPSNAAAKSLIMAQGMDLFLKTNGLFDLDKAQIFANCLMAYLVYCGHHSVLEIMEIWNRQLDFVAIERPEQLRVGIIPSEATTLPYMEETGAVERKLPYAVVGNYSKFLHPMYADEVIQRTKNQLEEGIDFRFDNEASTGSLRK